MKEQGTLRVYQTDGKEFSDRKAADGLFSIESEQNARTLFVIDRGEIAVGQVADLVLTDGDLVPQHTIVDGEVRF